jgi:hypothetical protein
MITSEEIQKLSKREKKTIAIHLLYSLGLLFTLGTLTILLGLLYNKTSITSTGIGICFVVCLVFLGASIHQHRKCMRELKDPFLAIITELNVHLDIAKQLIGELNNEFPELEDSKSSMVKMDGWSRADFIHYLSLLRLTEALDERLSQSLSLINSFFEPTIFKGIYLLEEPLTFVTRYDEHLLDHDMPDMPSATWLDSLKYLIDKIQKGKKALRKKNPLYTV